MEESKGRVFAISGDGEINGGSVWEAPLADSKHISATSPYCAENYVSQD